MIEEIWKPIKGFEGAYEVSTLGRVKSLKRKEAKILCACCRNGYLSVHLEDKYYAIHRLVGLAFVPNPENKPEIDHIDGNRSNNEVGNLRWCTHRENINNPLTIQKHKGMTGDRNGFYGKHHTKEAKERMSLAAKARTGEKNNFWGKHHTKETREIISQKRRATKK